MTDTCATCRFAWPIDPNEHWANGIDITRHIHCGQVGQHWRASVTPVVNKCWHNPSKWQPREP